MAIFDESVIAEIGAVPRCAAASNDFAT
jgi:hypothetical protein